MKDGWLKKARARIANEFISYICMGAFTLIFASMVILWQGFRTFLSTEYYFELPLWAWVIIGVVFSGLPLVMVLIKDRREKLTDPNAIKSKLKWYLAQSRDYVANETYNKRPVVWEFAKIDKT